VKPAPLLMLLQLVSRAPSHR